MSKFVAVLDKGKVKELRVAPDDFYPSETFVTIDSEKFFSLDSDFLFYDFYYLKGEFTKEEKENGVYKESVFLNFKENTRNRRNNILSLIYMVKRQQVIEEFKKLGFIMDKNFDEDDLFLTVLNLDIEDYERLLEILNTTNLKLPRFRSMQEQVANIEDSLRTFEEDIDVIETMSRDVLQ